MYEERESVKQHLKMIKVEYGMNSFLVMMQTEYWICFQSYVQRKHVILKRY
jgi:hypothetical protein